MHGWWFPKWKRVGKYIDSNFWLIATKGARLLLLSNLENIFLNNPQLLKFSTIQNDWLPIPQGIIIKEFRELGRVRQIIKHLPMWKKWYLFVSNDWCWGKHEHWVLATHRLYYWTLQENKMNSYEMIPTKGLRENDCWSWTLSLILEHFYWIREEGCQHSEGTVIDPFLMINVIDSNLNENSYLAMLKNSVANFGQSYIKK